MGLRPGLPPTRTWVSSDACPAELSLVLVLLLRLRPCGSEIYYPGFLFRRCERAPRGSVGLRGRLWSRYTYTYLWLLLLLILFFLLLLLLLFLFSPLLWGLAPRGAESSPIWKSCLTPALWSFGGGRLRRSGADEGGMLKEWRIGADSSVDFVGTEELLEIR